MARTQVPRSRAARQLQWHAIEPSNRACGPPGGPGANSAYRLRPWLRLRLEAERGAIARHRLYQGEYFANPDLTGTPVATRTDRPLRLEVGASKWPGSSLPAGAPDHGLSVRWTGEIVTALGGDYDFVVSGRGGFRFKVGNDTLIDEWAPTADQRRADRRIRVTRRLPDNASLPFKLEYSQGEGPAKISLEWSTPAADTGIADAIAVARGADAIIYVGGISAQLEGEEMRVPYEGFSGGDRTRIELPSVQQLLLQKLRALSKPIVFVCMSGSAVAMPWADDHLNAIVQSFYPGEAGGRAVADVLLGDYNPAGRLPVTFYRATSDLPPFEDYRMENRTYRYFNGSTLYPFGYGLSYTKFAYAQLKAEAASGNSLLVSIDVTNIGERDGDEVIQLYAIPPAASHPREHLALCGFERIRLKAGEKRSLNFTVPASAFRRWSDSEMGYIIPSGEWTIGAGASSADIRQTVRVRL